MKKHIHTFTKFSKAIGKGLKIEIGETIEIPMLIRRKEYKKAGYQVVDLFKMTALAIVQTHSYQILSCYILFSSIVSIFSLFLNLQNFYDTTSLSWGWKIYSLKFGKAYGVTISDLDKGFYLDKFRWGILKIESGLK